MISIIYTSLAIIAKEAYPKGNTTKFISGNSFKSQLFVCMYIAKFSDAYVSVYGKVWTFAKPWITERSDHTLVAIPYT